MSIEDVAAARANIVAQEPPTPEAIQQSIEIAQSAPDDPEAMAQAQALTQPIPITELDMIAEEIFTKAQIQFSEYEDLEMQKGFFIEMLRGEIGKTDPNFLFIAILEELLGMMVEFLRGKQAEEMANNPEVQAARTRHIPIVPRAVMLAELMRMKQGVAIAGTHGKTTTTSLVASVLAEAGLDPTFVIGGRLNSAGANAKLGTGDYIVVEADESDASFLNLLPVMAVVTNIDADHMETYGHDLAKLKGAFVEFLHRMPFYGTAIVCSDDPGIQSIVERIARPVTTYGLHEGAQVRALNVRADNGQMHFTVQRRNGVTLPDMPIVLNLPGEHNVLNALAAISVAVELGVDDAAVQRALAQFKGVGRRFQRYGDVATADGTGRFTVIDDYGHHPTEVQVTLSAAKLYAGDGRVLVIFQPHRYSRTKAFMSEFANALSVADAVFGTLKIEN
jgi:UDP-N-acetylmuramate--alanine ligase